MDHMGEDPWHDWYKEKIMDTFNMKLHEELHPNEPDCTTKIIRVPGGWIYLFYELEQKASFDGNWSENYRIESCFVPLNNEFAVKGGA